MKIEYIIEDIESIEQLDNFDNEEVQGWCLLRKSLHDPKMPLNMEVNRGSCRTLFGYVRESLEEYSDLK